MLGSGESTIGLHERRKTSTQERAAQSRPDPKKRGFRQEALQYDRGGARRDKEVEKGKKQTSNRLSENGGGDLRAGGAIRESMQQPLREKKGTRAEKRKTFVTSPCKK